MMGQKVDRELFVETVTMNPALTLKELAARFEVSPRTVSRIKTELGIADPHREAALGSTREEREAKALALLEEGYSLRVVARMAHVDARRLRRKFPQYLFTKEQTQEAAALGRALSRIEGVSAWNASITVQSSARS